MMMIMIMIMIIIIIVVVVVAAVVVNHEMKRQTQVAENKLCDIATIITCKHYIHNGLEAAATMLTTLLSVHLMMYTMIFLTGRFPEREGFLRSPRW